MTVKFNVTRQTTFDEFIPIADELATLSLGKALLSYNSNSVFITASTDMLVIDVEKIWRMIKGLDGQEVISVELFI